MYNVVLSRQYTKLNRYRSPKRAARVSSQPLGRKNMNLSTSSKILLTLSLACFLASAQEKTLKVNFASTPLNPAVTDLQQKAVTSLRQSLQELGAVFSDQADFLIGVNVVPIDTAKPRKVALSLIALRVIPNEVITFGRNSEIMYSNLTPEQRKQLPSEGKQIRQQLSEEFIRHFGSLGHNDIIITDEAELAMSIDQWVQLFVKRYTPR